MRGSLLTTRPFFFFFKHPEKQDGDTLLSTADSSTATEKNSSTISYLNYLIRVSKYYNRYQVSYTVYSKQDYTIGGMYHLIGVVYRIRRYTGVYRLLCMLLSPDVSSPGESM